jgi:hypothetical protein
MYSFNSGTRHLFIKIIGICASVIGNVLKSFGLRYIKCLLTVSFLSQVVIPSLTQLYENVCDVANPLFYQTFAPLCVSIVQCCQVNSLKKILSF